MPPAAVSGQGFWLAGAKLMQKGVILSDLMTCFMPSVTSIKSAHLLKAPINMTERRFDIDTQK